MVETAEAEKFVFSSQHLHSILHYLKYRVLVGLGIPHICGIPLN